MSTSTYTHLGFLREKISEIRSALFFSQNNSVLKLPSTVVHALEVDEVGQIWFFLHRPTQSLQEFDRAFPARLDFFRKGKHYFLRVSGRASIVTDPEEINELEELPEDVRRMAREQLVLVRFKILKADYFSSVSTRKAFSWKQLLNRMSKAIFPPKPEYRPYYFLEFK